MLFHHLWAAFTAADFGYWTIGGALSIGLALWAAIRLVHAVQHQEIKRLAPGGGIYWVRRAERPLDYWWMVGVFAVGIICGLSLAAMFVLGPPLRDW
jgi:hypothetical protein